MNTVCSPYLLYVREFGDLTDYLFFGAQRAVHEYIRCWHTGKWRNKVFRLSCVWLQKLLFRHVAPVGRYVMFGQFLAIAGATNLSLDIPFWHGLVSELHFSAAHGALAGCFDHQPTFRKGLQNKSYSKGLQRIVA
jgi:hypothetical protein